MSNVNRNKAENLLDEWRHGDTAAGRLSCFGSAELANQQKISHGVRRQFSWITDSIRQQVHFNTKIGIGKFVAEQILVRN